MTEADLFEKPCWQMPKFLADIKSQEHLPTTNPTANYFASFDKPTSMHFPSNGFFCPQQTLYSCNTNSNFISSNYSGQSTPFGYTQPPALFSGQTQFGIPELSEPQNFNNSNIFGLPPYLVSSPNYNEISSDMIATAQFLHGRSPSQLQNYNNSDENISSKSMNSDGLYFVKFSGNLDPLQKQKPVFNNSTTLSVLTHEPPVMDCPSNYSFNLPDKKPSEQLKKEIKYKSQSNDKRPFKCTQCGRAYKHKCNLITHRRIHKPNAPSCKYCKKKFTNKKDLCRHERTHTGIKPYSCIRCGRQFNDQSNLEKHMGLHTGQKRYGCTSCGKRFCYGSSLKRHLMLNLYCSHKLRQELKEEAKPPLMASASSNMNLFA